MRLSRMMAVAALLVLPAFSSVAAEGVTVFAAASLKEAVDAVAADWQAKGGETVTVSYGGSNALARQIIEGAPADIFISASEDWMDAVADAGLVAEGGRRDLLANRLVLVAHDPQAAPLDPGPGADLAARLGGGRLAMALVDAVPAGQYGKAALESLGLWEAVAPHVAQTDNVRAALVLVASGEAPYGVTYATDAAADATVRIVGTFPADTHPPIIYPAALLTDSAAAAAFFAELTSDEAGAVFTTQGFALLARTE